MVTLKLFSEFKNVIISGRPVKARPDEVDKSRVESIQSRIGKMQGHDFHFPCAAGYRTLFKFTVETKIIADPEEWFQELISEKLLLLLRDRLCLELIVVSSTFQALPFLRDNCWNQSESDEFQ